MAGEAEEVAAGMVAAAVAAAAVMAVAAVAADTEASTHFHHFNFYREDQVFYAFSHRFFSAGVAQLLN